MAHNRIPFSLCNSLGTGWNFLFHTHINEAGQAVADNRCHHSLESIYLNENIMQPSYKLWNWTIRNHLAFHPWEIIGRDSVVLSVRVLPSNCDHYRKTLLRSSFIQVSKCIWKKVPFPVQDEIFTTITSLNHTLWLLVFVWAMTNTVHLSPTSRNLKYVAQD